MADSRTAVPNGAFNGAFNLPSPCRLALSAAQSQFFFAAASSEEASQDATPEGARRSVPPWPQTVKSG
jgi:hypothetical protein